MIECQISMGVMIDRHYIVFASSAASNQFKSSLQVVQ